MSDLQNNRPEMVGLWAGTLAVTEVGLGSVMHGLHLPLAGTMLSLNQAAFLTRAVQSQQHDPAARSLPFEISAITAILKSLSPVGKKLTPMLAITAQGALFTMSIYLFGANFFGAALGSVLLATWGVLQPVALGGIMFWALSDHDQQKIIMSWSKLTAELPFLNVDNIGLAVTCFLVVKAAAAAAISLITWRLPNNKKDTWFTKWVHRLTLSANHKPLPISPGGRFSPFTGALRDLKQPIVLVSVLLLVSLAFLVDSNVVTAFWIGLRALAIVYITYVLLRILPWDTFLSGNSSSQRSLRAAINHLRSINSNSATGLSTEATEVDV
jgi:hypothetical protein